MFRKAAIAFIVVFTLGLIAAGYYLQKSKKIEIIDPFLTIPADATFIFETPDLPGMLSKASDRNGLFHRLGGMQWADDIVSGASFIDSITVKGDLRDFIAGRRVIISFHPVANSRLVPLAAVNVSPGISRHRLMSVLASTGAKVTQERESGGTKIYVAQYGSGSHVSKVYCAATGGVLVITPSEALMANALDNRVSGTDIRLQQGFSLVADAFGDNSDNLFILFRNLPAFFKGLVKPSLAGSISGAAVAAGGELDEKEEGLFLSGFIATSGSGTGADRIMDLVPGTPGVQEVLPSTTISFTTVMRDLLISGEPATEASSINATDIALSLSPYIESEVTTATVRTAAGYNDVILLRINDKSSADSVLNERLTAKYKSMGLKNSTFMNETDNGADGKAIIYKMPFPGIAAMMSQGQKLSFSDDYAMFCRSYIIFGQSPEALLAIADASQKTTTLINDHVYREVEKSLPTRSSFLFYGTTESLTAIMLEVLTPERAAALKQNPLASIGAMGLSLTPSNNMVYASLSIAYNSEEDAELQKLITAAGNTPDSSDNSVSSDMVLWKTALAAPPVIKPFVFINHTNNSKEIFVQDASNNIYLISSTGKVLWKTQIRERIRGDVYMIDYYSNGKNQLLFAGRDYIHLIDRNGRYVDRFPVRLKSPATNTLAVFDYDSNRDYRLFLAGEDNRVYAYDKSGSVVKGWKVFVSPSVITAPVEYFRAGGKDYIVVRSTEAMSILDRRGSTRITLKQPTGVAPSSALRLTKSGTLVFADKTGTVHFIDLNGQEEAKRSGGFSGSLFLDYGDINRDGMGEIVIIDKGMLSICRDDLSLMKTVTMPAERFLAGIVSPAGSMPYVAVTDDSKGLVWLIDSDGAVRKGFPVKGAVMPVAVRLSASTGNTLITGGPDSFIYCYRILK